MSDECGYPLIDVAGTPGEMGLAHGEQLKPRIHRTVEALRALVGEAAYDASWKDLQITCAYCEKFAPDLMDEIRGIAAGAGIDFREAFSVNAHMELLYWKGHVWNRRRALDRGACSTHAIVTTSEVLVGWNGDDRKVWMDCGAVIRGHPAGQEPFIYWSFAGSVGRPGMNRHLALGANTLPSRWRADGLLYPMLARRVLACRTTQETVAVFGKLNSCCGMNYLIADETGSLVSVEANADGFALVYPADQEIENYLLHTNCYLDRQLAGEKDIGDAKCSRLAAARRLYRENRPTNAAAVRAILSDHTGGICVHQEETCTIVSFVAEIRARRLSVIRGNPCMGSPQNYTLE